MINQIDPCFFGIPGKNNTIEHKINVHTIGLDKAHVQRQYVLAKIGKTQLAVIT